MTRPADERLPTLADALSPLGVDIVSRIIKSQSASADVFLIKHVAGERATLKYEFKDAGEPRRIIGKLYRSRRRAARMHRWLTTLTEETFPADSLIRVSRPVGLSEELCLVLFEHVDGDDLRHWLDHPAPFELAARWLARFHEMPLLEDLKVRTAAHEVEKAVQWLDSSLQHAPPDLRTRLQRARERLISLLDSLPPVELRPIHRDFYYANVLSDGQRVWAIDLDQLRIGDPALDVAHFAAHLEILAFRQTGDLRSYAPQADAFLTAYRAERPSGDIDQRLPIYAAYTFLKLAATEAGRARPGWEAEYRTFSIRACDELSA